MSSQGRIQQLEEMLQDEPNDPELRYMLGMEHVGLGQDERAVEIFQEIITLVPHYPPAYHMAGRALHRLNRWKEAREMLEKGVQAALAVGNQHAAGEMQGLLESLD